MTYYEEKNVHGWLRSYMMVEAELFGRMYNINISDVSLSNLKSAGEEIATKIIGEARELELSLL